MSRHATMAAKAWPTKAPNQHAHEGNTMPRPQFTTMAESNRAARIEALAAEDSSTLAAMVANLEEDIDRLQHNAKEDMRVTLQVITDQPAMAAVMLRLLDR